MIALEGLCKSFGGAPVLRGVDLVAERGENLVVIGASGSGKSVLLKCILGLITPDAGMVRWQGAVLGPDNRADFLARFGMLFQGAALFDSMPVWRNVAFRLLNARPALPVAEARARALDCLARVGLPERVADLFPAELSGGMQKRVGLARAIAARPEVLFFDEPTTGLDPVMAGVIDRLIADIVRDLGVCAITITHDMASVRRIADRVALLHEGRIRWRGDVAALGSDPDPVLRQFVAGSPEGPIAPTG